MLRFLLPTTCLHCGEHITTVRKAEPLTRYLCPDCSLTLRVLVPANESDLSGREHRFVSLRSRTSILAAYPFGGGNGVIQTLVHSAKYDSMMRLATTLGELLSDQLPAAFDRCDLLVPIPLHRTRLASRGYNQAERIARGIARRHRIKIGAASLLRRIKQTPTQTGLDRSEREENVRDAFAIGRNAATLLRGKRIVLLDDVMTTGATLASAATELDKVGPRSIAVVAFSYANDA